MARCGCGTECACEIRPGCGTTVTGSGDPEQDPYIIGIDPKTAAGDGLKPQGGQGCQLAVDTVPGGGIDHDPNGAIYASDAVPDVDPSKPSIASLLHNRVQERNLVGAYMGGYFHKPQSSRASVDNAADRGYDLLHLPVRFLADGTPVITPDPMLGRQNGNKRDFGNPTKTQDQTPDRWRALHNAIGVDDTRTGNDNKPNKEDPTGGWFGFLERNETGLLTLAETMRTIDNRVPLVLDLQFPIQPGDNGDTWADGQTPTPRRLDTYLRQLNRLIRAHNAQQYVIVTTRWPTLPPAEEGDQPRDVFDILNAPHIGLTLTSPEDADRLGPDTMPDTDEGAQNSRWVFASRTVPGDKLAGHVDNGSNLMYAPITRHADWDRLMERGNAVGVLSGDPEYTAGHVDNHPHYRDYPYRRATSPFHHSVITHGLIPPQETWWNQVHPAQRGLYSRYMPPEDPDHRGEYIIGKDTAKESKPSYWVLQGWTSPIPRLNPDDDLGWQFDLTLWVNVYRNYQAAGRRVNAEVAFCRPNDAPLPQDGLAGASDKSGYIVSYRTSGRGKSVAVVCWDPGNNDYIEMANWNISNLDNSWTGIRIRVRDSGITVAVVNRNTGATLDGAPPLITEQADNPTIKRLGAKTSGNRGGYVFFGRSVGDGDPGAPNDPESAAFARVLAMPNDGPAPQPGDGDGGDGGNGGDNPPPPPPDNEQPPPPPPPEEEKPPPPPPPPPEPETYVVQSGETLSGIAQKLGVSQQALQEANGIDNPDALQEGQVLKVPR